MTWPDLTSRIDPLLEWLDPDSLHGFEENLIGSRAQLQIGRHDILDHVRHFGIGDGGTDRGAEPGLLVSAAADGYLEEFLAVLLDPEEPDMAHMVMAAGIDA